MSNLKNRNSTLTHQNTRIYSPSEELVSTIIGVFNGDKYLTATLESVLNQTYRPLEIIIINDGSTDNTLNIAEQYAQNHPQIVRVHHQENRGVSAARNKGVALARGKWIAFLDADDLWLPTKISRQMEATREGALFVTSLATTFWSEDVPVALRHQHAANQPLAHAASAFLGDRETFLKVGGFNEETRNASEWIEWSLLAAETGVQMTIVPEVLHHRRLHLSNCSRVQEGRLSLIKSHLDRQRVAKRNK